MTNCCKVNGFVFKKEDRLDTDRDFSIFTEEFGRLKVFGKAIRKITSKLKSGIDVFSISEIEFVQGKSKKTLTDAIFIQKFSNIISSPKRFEVANQIVKVLDDFVKEQERDDGLFYLLKDSFEKLNDNSLKKENCNLIYYYFLWNFFSILGFKPELQKCANCFSELNQHKIYFSDSEGGVICEKCLTTKNKSKKINSDVIKILRLILEKNWQTIFKLKIDVSSQKILREVSDDYYFYLLNK